MRAILSKLIGQSGEVEFNAVINESVEMNNRITNEAVEGGSIADHVSKEPAGLPITGVVAGEDAGQKLSKLRDFANNAELLTFIGRNVITNLVIENLVTRHTTRVRDGFEFDLTLRQVNLVQVRELQITAPTISPTQTNDVQDKGTQQPSVQEPFFTFRPRGS